MEAIPNLNKMKFLTIKSHSPALLQICKGLIVYFLLLASIFAAESSKCKGYGSGAIISNKGLVVTCAHVVKGGNKYTLYYNNQKYEASLLEVIDDRGQDIALLRCQELAGKPAFTVKPSSGVKPGETVFALGFPEAAELGKEIKITKGEICSKTGYKNDSNIWQTSADIHPGSSGGPFLDEWGNLIGIANSYIPEERISYCMKIQLLLDAAESYIGEMDITKESQIPSVKSGLLTNLVRLISDQKRVKKSMSEIRESSADKVVVVEVY